MSKAGGSEFHPAMTNGGAMRFTCASHRFHTNAKLAIASELPWLSQGVLVETFVLFAMIQDRADGCRR